jgi:hypothetical protein
MRRSGDQLHRRLRGERRIPKRCPWLNQVEMWFSVLARRLLKPASFKSIYELRLGEWPFASAGCVALSCRRWKKHRFAILPICLPCEDNSRPEPGVFRDVTTHNTVRHFGTCLTPKNEMPHGFDPWGISLYLCIYQSPRDLIAIPTFTEKLGHFGIQAPSFRRRNCGS